MTTYLIKTTTGNLTQNYATVSGGWEFKGSADENEMWVASTERPDAFERLLDQDTAVISYEMVQE